MIKEKKLQLGVIGLNDKVVNGVIIPFNKGIDGSCRVYHLPNNDVNDDSLLFFDFDNSFDSSF